MKIIQVIFLLSLLNIAFIKSDKDYCDESKIKDNDYSVDKCKDAKKGDGYCCYYERPSLTKDKKGCAPLSKYEYDHIDALVKYYQAFGGDKGETEDKDALLDCKSQSLQFSLIILILLFL